MTWTGRRVLVTGAGGFIASHLAGRLAELGARVRAFVHYNAAGTRGWLDREPVEGLVDVVAGDVCDRDSIRRAMEHCDVVFHLAALITIPYSYKAPASFLRTNAEGTMNVVQCARELGTERVVHTSTSEVYGTARTVPIDESHPLQAQSPYAASKTAADKVAESFHLAFGVPVVTVRPFNTYGPRQSARAIVPTIISQYLAGGRVRLGNLTPTRDLTFVADTVAAFIKAGEAPHVVGRTINVGSGREISIGDLAVLIGRLIGCAAAVDVVADRVRPAGSEVERLIADASLAGQLLDWRPEVTLEEGLGRTIEWVASNTALFRPAEYVI